MELLQQMITIREKKMPGKATAKKVNGGVTKKSQSSKNIVQSVKIG